MNFSNVILVIIILFSIFVKINSGPASCSLCVAAMCSKAAVECSYTALAPPAYAACVATNCGVSTMWFCKEICLWIIP